MIKKYRNNTITQLEDYSKKYTLNGKDIEHFDDIKSSKCYQVDAIYYPTMKGSMKKFKNITKLAIGGQSLHCLSHFHLSNVEELTIDIIVPTDDYDISHLILPVVFNLNKLKKLVLINHGGSFAGLEIIFYLQNVKHVSLIQKADSMNDNEKQVIHNLSLIRDICFEQINYQIKNVC